MYNIKRERTGRILNANFDHETETLSGFNTRAEAEAEIRNRFKGLKEQFPGPAAFAGTETDFTMTVDDDNYKATEHFYIVEE